MPLYRAVCPPVEDYDEDFLNELKSELKANADPAVVRVLHDYFMLRFELKKRCGEGST